MLTWDIGRVRITSVAELHDIPLPGPGLFPAATTEELGQITWLRPRFADESENIYLRIQALVVESEGRRIVVDTCIGNDKVRTLEFMSGMRTSFLSDLAD